VKMIYRGARRGLGHGFVDVRATSIRSGARALQVDQCNVLAKLLLDVCMAILYYSGQRGLHENCSEESQNSEPALAVLLCLIGGLTFDKAVAQPVPTRETLSVVASFFRARTHRSLIGCMP